MLQTTPACCLSCCHNALHLIFIVVVFPLSYLLYFFTATFVALASPRGRWKKKGRGKKRGLNLASVFRCTNGITEAKMAGGERWVHREQQKALHRCSCCRSAKALDCDGMGGMCVLMCMCWHVRTLCEWRKGITKFMYMYMCVCTYIQ